jgi:chromosome segregation ATPase
MDEKATFVEPQARIQTLETLLGQSRAREEVLTTQAFKDRDLIGQLRTQIGQLQARNEESAAAVAEAERKLAIVRVELESRRTEVERLGASITELHRELESVATAATAAVDRARAQRHLREQAKPATPSPEAQPPRVVDLSEERKTSDAGWQKT